MDLCATHSAKFFMQNEYNQIELDDSTITLSSDGFIEKIPFSVWNGEIRLKPGLFWDAIEVSSHIDENDKQSIWLVQGLPKNKSKRFAQVAIKRYQEWHYIQCRKLNEYLPLWEEELTRLNYLPAFLPYSQVKEWVDLVTDQFDHIDMSLHEAYQRLPHKVEALLPWLEETQITLTNRNQQWLQKERENWEVLFSQLESSALNRAQQEAVLLNNDHNLVLAGAGSGKTSVLMARVAYLLQSHLAKGEQILLLAFGSAAASEMKQRLKDKLGLAADNITVATFHQLGLNIIKDVEKQPVELTPLASDKNQMTAWCIDWLKKHWMTPTNFKRWQKHLDKWPIAYISGDEELGSQVENTKLIGWLSQQLDLLNRIKSTKKVIQQQIVEHEEYARLNSELALVWPCYQAWQQELKENNQIDFPSMISKATQYVEKNKFRSQWKFIMVDEYQDISPDRLALVEALCRLDTYDGSPSLFAVGDDWQAIYQFAGSDVDLTSGFDQRFPHASIHHLQTTYRFNSQIGDVANKFVQQNPHQYKKTLDSHKQQKQKAVTLMHESQIEETLGKLNEANGSKKSVLLLGRNHYHKPERLREWSKLYPQLELRFMTCHSSKGQEADYVFILSVNEGQFPAHERVVHLNNAMQSSNDDYPFAEERRLFYVAMTRAKKKVWITYGGQPSIFVNELKSNDYPIIIG